mgnify:CR=1 FL=1
MFRYDRPSLRLQETYNKKELVAMHVEIVGKKPKSRFTKWEVADAVVDAIRKHLSTIETVSKWDPRYSVSAFKAADPPVRKVIFSVYDGETYGRKHAEW